MNPQGPSPDLARARRVEAVLARLDALPTLPSVAARLLSLGSARDTPIDQIVRVIESDPALASRMLSLCRRVDKAIREPIRTVKRAVVMLGVAAVRAAALSVCVYDVLRDPAADDTLDEDLASRSTTASTPLDRAAYWRHCVAVACAAEILAQRLPNLRVVPEEAGLAGLLHGVGRLALDRALPRTYAGILALAQRRACPSALVERQVLGLDHHAAGKRLAEAWQLPEPLHAVILLHGSPAPALPKDEHHPLLLIVLAAKALCRQMHLGHCADFGPPPDLDELWHQLGIRGPSIAELAQPLHELLSERLRVLGLDDATPPALLAECFANANAALAQANARLEQRARHARDAQDVLHAVATFHAALPPPPAPLAQTAAAAIASLRDAAHASFAALLLHPGKGEPWRCISPPQDAAASHPDERIIEDPPQGPATGLRAARPGRGAMNATTLGLLPWLAEALAHAPDLRSLRILALPLPMCDEGESDAALAPSHVPTSTPTALAVLDAEFPPPVGQTRSWDILLGAMGHALAQALALEASRRRAEDLAHAHLELERARESMADAAHLARVGEIAAGAAHEFNNPLAVIRGHSQLLLERLQDAKDRDALARIDHAAERVAELVRTLHSVATRERPTPAAVSLRAVIQDAITRARARLPGANTTPIQLDEQDAPDTLHADGSLLAAALEELLVNALQASPEKPIRLAVERDALDGRILLTVRDQGPGLTAHALRHAFDPFFSHRPAGRGKGLGLTRARRLARSMGGDATLDSTPGSGTLASIWLPAA